MRRAFLLSSLFLVGCVPAQKQDLQPLVAAAGSYAMMEYRAEPTPAPEPESDKCVAGCKCNGTGKEVSGDGVAIVGCRCPDTCKCKSHGRK